MIQIKVCPREGNSVREEAFGSRREEPRIDDKAE